MKQYIIFAGCNGVGKSTLFQTNPKFKDLPRINMDEILREFGSWKNPEDAFKAGKIALQKIDDFFRQKISFNQETTLCGKGIFRNIERAKKLGYSIFLYYVGVESVEIAKDRVRIRVSKGGHGIPEEDIERRYRESLSNVAKIISECDVVEFYDNSQAFVRVGRVDKGKISFIRPQKPSWMDFVLEHL